MPRAQAGPARVRNPAQTRSRLLQASVELMARNGVEAVSLKEAARLARVSRGVAYQHFNDRDHLLREAKAWIAERLLAVLAQSDPGDAEGQLLRMTRLILDNRDACTLLLGDALAGRALAPDHPITRLLRQLLEGLKSSGAARADLDVEILAYIFLGMVSSLIMLGHVTPDARETLAQRFSDELLRFMQKGIFNA